MSFIVVLCQEDIPIRNEFVRKFKIESVTGHSFEIKNGVQSTSRFKSHLLTFSRSGNKIHQQKYSREGKINLETIYDSKGRPLREIAYDPSGNISYRFEFVYNHDDNWIEQLMYLSGDELNYRIVLNRDAKGTIIEGTYYAPSGQRIRTDSYIYDNRGNLEKISMGHMGEWICEYDENDNLTRKTGNLPSASAFGESFEHQYDDQGLLIQTNHLYHSVTVFKYTFWV